VYEEPAPEEQAQPEPEPERVTPPEPKRAAELGFDPNTTTDAKVINSYPLTSREKNTLGIRQRSAYNMYAKKKYRDALAAFSKLADDYPEINYLSAYWAGMTSLKIKNGRAEALEWFNRALEINPDYKPAATEKAKLEKKK
jgi:tetratricopeptide (TPR) repeat protein